MALQSPGFLFFAAALLAGYYLVPGSWQGGLLLAGSLGYYALAARGWPLLPLVTAVSAWAAARYFMYNGPGNKGKNRPALAACLALNFGLLLFCKACQTEPLYSFVRATALEPLTRGLPLGMSFYIFMAMGYVLDVYRGRLPAEKSLWKTALFTLYFPQLIQGPISRGSELLPQLLIPRPFSGRQVSFGLQRMLWGYFKKLVIADRVAPAVAALRAEGEGGAFLLLTILYALEIYADFTGGIDIVLGYSQALGITLPENFRHPFFSKNIAEYWRRWHITLGTWMRDYVYYPISVSCPIRRLGRAARKRLGGFGKRLPVYLATAATWAVTGLWHGLTPSFLTWGMLNCLVIIVSQELAPLYRRFHSRFGLKKKPWYAGFEMLRMFFLMNLIRACDLFLDVGEYFRRLGTLFSPALWRFRLPELGLTPWDWVLLALGAGTMLTVSILEEKRGSLRELLWERWPLRWALTFGLFLAVLLFGRYGVGYEASSFIYNRF